MAVEKKLHLMTTGSGTKIAVSLPDIYNNIKDIVGIKLAGAKDVPDDSSEVNLLRKYGRAVELTVTLKDAGPRRVLCAIEKVSGAIKGVVGKTIGGKTITSARIPRRRRRG